MSTSEAYPAAVAAAHNFHPCASFSGHHTIAELGREVPACPF
jgi:hypothetical protein